MEFQRRYGLQTTIRFPVLVSGSQDFATSSDWTPATGDTKISKDGGNFANATNNPTAIGGTGSAGWALTLTATELQCNEVSIQIIDAAIEDQWLVVSTRLGTMIEASHGCIIGQVSDATFPPAADGFEAARLSPNTTEETTADHYNGRILTFTSGVLLGQQTDITEYVLANSLEKFSVSTLTEAPSDGDRFVIT